MTNAGVWIGAERGDNLLHIDVGGPDATFLFEAERIEAQALAPLDDTVVDLLTIACVVFAADGAVRRGGDTRADFGAAWRRDLTYVIPVRQPALWSSGPVQRALVDAVSFLTDDDVRFEFQQARHEHGHAVREPFLQFDGEAPGFGVDEVILFSGGLDSFAGALEALATRPGRVVLLSHRSAQKVMPRQDRLGKRLAQRFNGRVLHVQVRAHRRGADAVETTQRSRSFLFTAMGYAAARALQAKRISFYENGVISHNLPISPQVIGTMATRTTHPQTLQKLERLLDLLGEHIPLGNPYEWLTKREVVERIATHGEAEQIKHAVSCTKVRAQSTEVTHCGACSQCLDRRFAVVAAGLERHDPAGSYKTDVFLGERSLDPSRTIALDWTSHAWRMAGIDELEFFGCFAGDLARICAGYPDVAPAETIRRSVDLHQRHGRNARSALEAMLQRHVTAMLGRELPATSLLRLFAAERIGGAPSVRIASPRPPSLTADSADDIGAVFWDGRLEVSFRKDGLRYMVDVRDLDTVSGRPAEIAHGLKAAFDADRRAGLRPQDHQFVPPGAIPSSRPFTKRAVIAAVKRCRDQLAEAHEAQLGRSPDRDLLIETRPQRGYRLDPEIHVVAEEHAASPNGPGRGRRRSGARKRRESGDGKGTNARLVPRPP